MKKIVFVIGFVLVLFVCLEGVVCAENSETMIKEWFGDRTETVTLLGVLNENIYDVIEDYFELRKTSLFESNDIDSSYLSQIVQETENLRRKNIIEMEKKMNIDIVNAVNNVDILNIDVLGGEYIVTIYEWVFYDYDDLDVDGFVINVSGFGVEHKMVIDNKFCIVTDEYDESDLTGINTLPEVENKKQEIPNFEEVELLSWNDEIQLAAAVYSSYNPDAAATYADKYTYNYNTAYANFNSLGGDCANFTSQSIYAGGMPQVVGSAYGTNGWYYKTSTDRSATWTGAPQLRTWMANNRGTLVNSPNSSQIYKGSPVFYDWYNDGVWDHATICVGINSEGTPIIDSHNADRYHVKWNYGYAETNYSTVQLTSSNNPSSKPTNVTIKYSSYNNAVNTDVTFDFTYSNADWEAIVITNLDTNERIHVKDVTGKTTYTYKFTTSGKYKVMIETWNNDTYCTTSSCQVNVYDKSPSNVTITADKTYVSTNETVKFSFTQKDATYWYFTVSRNDVREYVELMTGKYEYSYSFAEEGEYKVQILTANDYGWTNVPIIITVSNTPEKPALKFMQSHYNINNDVIFVWDKTGGTTHHNLYIHKKNADGNYVSMENIFYAETGLTKKLEPGDYKVFLQSTNSNISGWPFCNSDIYYFSVSDEYIPTDVIDYNGHKYLVYDYALSWYDAKDLCENMGGYLATITSEDEYEIIKECVNKGNMAGYHLGGTDEDVEGEWKWVTEEPWTFDQFWKTNEPNNYQGNEDCLHMNSACVDINGNDIYVDRGFICEIEEPYTETLYTTYDGSYYICETQLYNVTEDCYIVIAKYDGNVLSGIEIREYTKEKESFVAMGNVDKIKVMLWKDLNAQEELCKAETVELTK